MFNIVLCWPEIPPNTGNVARLCVATGAALHLIKPIGFSLADRDLKRAGLDYWHELSLTVHESLDDFLRATTGRLYFYSSRGMNNYTDIIYEDNDHLVFGGETAGLPVSIFERYPDRIYTIPMFGTVRCLNLSNSVAIVLYEALRQTKGF